MYQLRSKINEFGKECCECTLRKPACQDTCRHLKKRRWFVAYEKARIARYKKESKLLAKARVNFN